MEIQAIVGPPSNKDKPVPWLVQAASLQSLEVDLVFVDLMDSFLRGLWFVQPKVERQAWLSPSWCYLD